jgi:protein-tyrosine phosphatase
METTVINDSDDEEEDPHHDVDQEEARENSSRSVDQDWDLDLHWLTGQVAVGSRFPIKKAAQLSGEYGISAVVDLREEDRDDEELLQAAGIELLHLPTVDMEPASARMLDEGVHWVAERVAAGGKVLIHCQHGIGRSALLALCVLVDQGWSPLDALAHAKDRRRAVSPSRSQYDGWAAWLASRGMEPPDYHSFGCIAYRHLAQR